MIKGCPHLGDDGNEIYAKVKTQGGIIVPVSPDSRDKIALCPMCSQILSGYFFSDLFQKAVSKGFSNDR